jgi:Bifunctional DNA primase/polymerase, N-terminal
MTDLLNAALNYAKLGLPVFPCNPKDKRPLVAHGFYAATTDADQIKALWTRFTNAMIGMPTGEKSGIDVLISMWMPRKARTVSPLFRIGQLDPRSLFALRVVVATFGISRMEPSAIPRTKLRLASIREGQVAM